MYLKLTLCNFRCWKRKEFTFPLKGTVLLLGKHGSGKSTILNAIKVCLFGETGSKNIPHDFNSKEESFVELIIPSFDITIKRFKKPSEILTVVSSNNLYEGETAQFIINNLFVSKEVWETCSYLSQLRRYKNSKSTLLLTGTASERLEILSTLAFNSSNELKDFDSKIEIVESQIKNVNSEIEGTKIKLSQLEDIKIVEEEPLLSTEEHLNLVEESKSIYIEYQALISEIPKSKLILKQQSELISEITETKRRLKESSKMPILPIKSLLARKDELTIIKINAESLLKKDNLLKQFLEKKSEIEVSLKNLDVNEEISDDEYREKLKKIELYSKYLDNVSKLKSLCGKEIPEDKRKILLESLEVSLSLKHQILTLRKTRDTIDKIKDNLKFDDNLQEDLEENNKILHNIISKKSVKVCPNCHCNLIDNCGKLDVVPKSGIIADELEEIRIRKRVTELENKLEEVKGLKSSLQFHINQERSLLEDNPNLDTYPLPPLNSKEIIDILRELDKPEEPNCSLDLLNKRKSFTKHNQELKILNEKIDLIGNVDNIDLKPIYKELSEVNEEIEKTAKIVKSIEESKTKLELLEEKLALLPQVFLEEMEQKIVRLKNDYTRNCDLLTRNQEISKRNRESKKTLSEIDELKFKIIDLSEDITALNSLKQDRIENFYLMLERTASQINDNLQNILEQFFPEGISVKLLLFKETKGGKFRPDVNIKIIYKNSEYKTISELSGGEDSLVTLALTIALSKFNRSPFLLLDESVSTISEDHKEIVLDYLSENVGKKKLVIVIEHSSIDSQFDDTIYLN